eukprot:6174881-Pleurochrysis_carterae.AAC.1
MAEVSNGLLSAPRLPPPGRRYGDLCICTFFQVSTPCGRSLVLLKHSALFAQGAGVLPTPDVYGRLRISQYLINEVRNNPRHRASVHELFR